MLFQKMSKYTFTILSRTWSFWRPRPFYYLQILFNFYIRACLKGIRQPRRTKHYTQRRHQEALPTARDRTTIDNRQLCMEVYFARFLALILTSHQHREFGFLF